jgi:hypothetical protein
MVEQQRLKSSKRLNAVAVARAADLDRHDTFVIALDES